MYTPFPTVQSYVQSVHTIPHCPGKPLVFGVGLDELTLVSSHKVPFIVRKIVEHIEENGRLGLAMLQKPVHTLHMCAHIAVL